MKSFHYTLTHDRAMPLASINCLTSIANRYRDTTGNLEMGSRRANLTQPLFLASMGLRKGDQVTVSVDGPSEEQMFEELSTYFDTAM